MSTSQGTGAPTPDIDSVYNGIKTGHQKGQEVLFLIRFLKQLFDQIVYLVAYPWLLLLHYNFGERYLSFWLVFLTASITNGVALVCESVVGGLLSNAFLIAWAVHAWRIHRRNKKGVRWHSYCAGTPWLSRLPHRFTVKQAELYLEPALIWLLGLILLLLTLKSETYQSMWGSGTRYSVDGFSRYMMFSGVCLMIYQYGRYKKYRHMILDSIDQQIVSEHMAEALNGNHDIQQTEGFIVEGAESWSDEHRRLMQESLMTTIHQDNNDSFANVA